MCIYAYICIWIHRRYSKHVWCEVMMATSPWMWRGYPPSFLKWRRCTSSSPWGDGHHPSQWEGHDVHHLHFEEEGGHLLHFDRGWPSLHYDILYMYNIYKMCKQDIYLKVKEMATLLLKVREVTIMLQVKEMQILLSMGEWSSSFLVGDGIMVTSFTFKEEGCHLLCFKAYILFLYCIHNYICV